MTASLQEENERLRKRLAEFEMAREWVDDELTKAGHSPSTIFEAGIPENMTAAVWCALLVVGERAKAAEWERNRLLETMRRIETYVAPRSSLPDPMEVVRGAAHDALESIRRFRIKTSAQPDYPAPSPLDEQGHGAGVDGSDAAPGRQGGVR